MPIACLALLAGTALAAGSSPSIKTVAGSGAGNGPGGFGGDGGPAAAGQLNDPRGVEALSGGGFLIADHGNNRIRKVSADGNIHTVAGTGDAGYGGDGGPATGAKLNEPFGVAATEDGGFLIADRLNHRVRKVSASGRIVTVAGTGKTVTGPLGDGGPATQANVNTPVDVAALPGGGYLIAEQFGQRIRKVDDDGKISTVAGDGAVGGKGDQGPARQARFNLPSSVSPTSDGGFLIADRTNNRIRKVGRDGTIHTVAGTGDRSPRPELGGDGGLATEAKLALPTGVRATEDGGFLIADQSNHRVRRVAPDGRIRSVAGLNAGFSGDGGSPTVAYLRNPAAVSMTPGGGFLIADRSNQRIRFVNQLDPDPPTAGVSVTVVRGQGTVSVKPKGDDSRTVASSWQIRLGSQVDAREGTLTLNAARNEKGDAGSARVGGGLFEVTQGPGPQRVVELALGGADVPSRCRGEAKAVRKLRLSGDGGAVFQLRGRFGKATAGNAAWRIEESCAGTLARVTRGTVKVFDTKRGLRRTVKAGHSYLARP